MLLEKFINHPRFATREHLLARSLGGSNAPANLVLACKECNNGRLDGRAFGNQLPRISTENRVRRLLGFKPLEE